jgi:hypothetical protein
MTGKRPGRRARPTAPPATLDPVFAIIERIDRRRRGIRPLRDDGILGVEVRRHRGRAVWLPDGTRIEPGTRIVDLHLDNTRIAGVWAAGWRVTFETAQRDLRACAAWLATIPPPDRPVAVRSGGLLTAGAARLGFTVGPRRGGFMGALESWYLRGLLARWSRAGRARLDAGRRPLRTRVAWLSTAALSARYGPGAGSTRRMKGPSRGPPRTRRCCPSGPAASLERARPACRARATPVPPTET